MTTPRGGWYVERTMPTAPSRLQRHRRRVDREPSDRQRDPRGKPTRRARGQRRPRPVADRSPHQVEDPGRGSRRARVQDLAERGCFTSELDVRRRRGQLGRDERVEAIGDEPGVTVAVSGDATRRGPRATPSGFPRRSGGSRAGRAPRRSSGLDYDVATPAKSSRCRRQRRDLRTSGGCRRR